ncbi:hypothetical protein [Rhodococcus sp. IEGM 1379]|uniref:hypothetical protein n=1 Tax=Rhodococcus sp. IEGM 1379 TaxID=3047086 RepID=UPI0024B7312B|nr:hypothetical protein [Rhodococcus sp. IEGM 1379]MDI9915417.1 hypothetical protein [Rhodococcus sp. IEGM 1379]
MQEHDPLGQMNFPLIRSLSRMSGMFLRSGLIVLALFIVASLAFGETPAQGAIVAFIVLLLGSGMALWALARSKFTDLR